MARTNSPPQRPVAWAARWEQLARSVGLARDERLTVALSGGADSVLLLHLLAEACPRPAFRAVHVDHGLRGEESAGDAAFCAALCRSLGVPLTVVRVGLDPEAPDLEARAREARYGVLRSAARASGHTTVITGHHADDALETLLMRWIRGSQPAGLGGIPRRTVLSPSLGSSPDPSGDEAQEVTVVRPLINLRREEVRRLLRDRGVAWREDSSNGDPRFTRNRVRERLVPALERVCGPEGMENLRAFGRAVESLEEKLAGQTAHLAWSPPPFALASRARSGASLGGVLLRSELMALSAPLRRRALWRLLTEGTGAGPRRGLLTQILEDLSRGKCTRHTLAGRWSLVLRAHELQLLPPPGSLGPRATDHPPTPRGAPAHPLEPGPRDAPASGGSPRAASSTAGPEPGTQRVVPGDGLALAPPGYVLLPDGRRLSAEVYSCAPGSPVPLGACEVELDADGLPPTLTVRWPRAGERFHPLGAPGSKSLTRFLADAGVPRDERERVPLVCAADQVLWVAGVRPSERWRVRPTTERRLRLCLHASKEEAPGPRLR